MSTLTYRRRQEKLTSLLAVPACAGGRAGRHDLPLLCALYIVVHEHERHLLRVERARELHRSCSACSHGSCTLGMPLCH